ncbi:hypothetical protein D3C81_1277720 [compost metagenome]
MPTGVDLLSAIVPTLELRNAQRSGSPGQQITGLIGLTRIHWVLAGIQLPTPRRGDRVGTAQCAAFELQQHRRTVFVGETAHGVVGDRLHRTHFTAQMP